MPRFFLQKNNPHSNSNSSSECGEIMSDTEFEEMQRKFFSSKRGRFFRPNFRASNPEFGKIF